MSTPAQRRREREEAAGRALGYTADFLSGIESREARGYSSEVAAFNRRVDLLQLGMHGAHLAAQQAMRHRYTADAVGEMTAADERHALYGLAAELAAAERGYSTWLTGSRERVLEQTKMRELDVRHARNRVEWVRNQNQRTVNAASMAQVAAQRDVEATERVRGLAVLEARGVQIAEEAGFVQERLAADRTALAAGEARGVAARLAMEGGAAARREARVDQVRQEIGAAAVSGAARGMRGSFRRTEALRAVREGARDLALFEAEDGLKRLQLGEERAGLHVRRTELEVGREAELGRLAVAGAQRDADEAMLYARGGAAGAALDVRGAENVVREQTRQAEAGVLAAQRHATAGAREAAQEQIQQGRRDAAVREGRLSLQRGEALAQQRQTRRDRLSADIRRQKAGEEINLGGMAIAINTYIRDSLPDLPDYEAQGTRAVLGQVLSRAAEELD